MINEKNGGIKLIAYYLPQFHAIPENDRWWGKGFTEWTAVKKGKPLFKDHYQPRVPAEEIGYYNLLELETIEKQIELAKEYGIYGFCYYHYWSNGKQLLEKPFEIVLKNKKLNHPFCLCWANHNWTRKWAGTNELLHLQEYGDDELWKKHFRYLLPAFKDKRYIRIDGKPVFLIYRMNDIPCLTKMMTIWQQEAKKANLKGVYIVKGLVPKSKKLKNIECDATAEFHPIYLINNKRTRLLFSSLFKINNESRKFLLSSLFSLLLPRDLLQVCNESNHHNFLHNFLTSKNNALVKIYSYDVMCESVINRKKVSDIQFRGIFVSKDNTARSKLDRIIIPDSTPEKYEKYLKEIIKKTKEELPSDKRYIFINAWNEWAEGVYLEPDEKYGRAYLEATKRALG